MEVAHMKFDGTGVGTETGTRIGAQVGTQIGTDVAGTGVASAVRRVHALDSPRTRPYPQGQS